MSKPMIHAISSAKRYGGTPEDFLPVHDFMDSSKGAVADNRHRALTHNAWFIAPNGPLERAFGTELLIPREDLMEYYAEAVAEMAELQHAINLVRGKMRACARSVSIRDLGEQHILEDFQGRFIPTAQDYMEGMPMKAWMDNGNRGTPPSAEGVIQRRVTKTVVLGD